MSPRAGGSLRPVGLAGLAWGALLRTRGPQLFRLVQGRVPSPGERTALVVLGDQHGGQAVLRLLAPHHLAVLYASVDALHAASTAVVAGLAPQRRAAALVSGAAAALAGVAALHERSS